MDVAPAVAATAICVVVDRSVGGAQGCKVLRRFSSTGGSWLTWCPPGPIGFPASSLLERGERLSGGGARHGGGTGGCRKRLTPTGRRLQCPRLPP